MNKEHLIKTAEELPKLKSELIEALRDYSKDYWGVIEKIGKSIACFSQLDENELSYNFKKEVTNWLVPSAALLLLDQVDTIFKIEGLAPLSDNDEQKFASYIIKHTPYEHLNL